MSTATLLTARTWADRLAAVLSHAEHLDLPEPTDWQWQNAHGRVFIRVVSMAHLMQWAVALDTTVDHVKDGTIAIGELLEVPVMAWYAPEGGAQ